MIDFNESRHLDKLIDFKKHEQEHLAQRLASANGLSYTDLSVVSFKTNAVATVSEEDAKEGHLAVFEKINKKIKVGVLSPTYQKTIEILKNLENEGYICEVYVVSEESLRLAWKVYEDLKYTEKKAEGSFEVSEKSIKKFQDRIKSRDDVNQLINELIGKKSISDTSSILEVVLSGAINLKASDIHFEPTENHLRLRYRMDGSLLDMSTIPLNVYLKILSRIKLLSGLKLNIKNTAQDGRFSVDIVKKEIEIRTSVIPGGTGESIVLRILDPENISISLEEMGMRKEMYDIFIKEIHKPNGMILTTGPTGSGKTTALYASLKKIYTPEKKILTIENPIEYHLPGIVQTQTDHSKGYTFSKGLRSALRQDPDVIMVGEIRDEETAEIAVNAALTGHLVFSTLHTNNAAGTFPRLIDLGINEKTLGSAINLSMAQRLIRRLCLHCRKKREIKEERQSIEMILNSVTNKDLIKNIQTDYLWEPVGCEKCHRTGYKGRIGIFEGIRMNSVIENVVINNPSERDIKKAAASQGILTMEQDGVLRALEGITSYKEVSGLVSLQRLN
jgi:type II secretory ATPase GspE/PulE/Tfp pilus assembly ATPase PilB-like protein